MTIYFLLLLLVVWYHLLGFKYLKYQWGLFWILWLPCDFQCKSRNARNLLPWANMMNLSQKNTGSMGTHFLNFPHKVYHIYLYLALQSTDLSPLEEKNSIPFAFENQSWVEESSQLLYIWILTTAELYCTYYL